MRALLRSCGLAEREEILKTSAGAESFSLFDRRLRAGYHPQYPRNTLQLNRGGGENAEQPEGKGAAITTDIRE